MTEKSNQKFHGFTLVELLVVIVMLGLLVGLLLPARRSSREAANRMLCTVNLKQIGLAILEYEKMHGQFPPTYTVDENGQRLHSWRTLILPFMEQEQLFKSIDLSKPWDHPVNKAAFTKTPKCYKCPSHNKLEAGMTCYCAIVGEDSVLQPKMSCRLLDINDDPKTTAMVFDSDFSATNHWMSPYDAVWNELVKNLKTSQTIHQGSVRVVLSADGTVTWFNRETPPQVLLDCATKNGGEKIPDNFGRDY